jgi:hypothetical protein
MQSKGILIFCKKGKKINVPYLATSSVDGATQYISHKTNNTEIMKLFSLFITKMVPQ